MNECLSDIINENCLLILREINQELRRRLPAKLLYSTGRLKKFLTGCWYVWNWLDHYQRIGTGQMLYRCASIALIGSWPQGLWINPFSLMNAAITSGRLEAMEERELASERIVRGLSNTTAWYKSSNVFTSRTIRTSRVMYSVISYVIYSAGK